MKATATQYAKTLYELTINKKHQEIDGIISNFIKNLQKSNQLRLKDSIAKKFREIFNLENGIVEAEVITREKISSEVSNKVRTMVRTKYGTKEVVLKNIIDESIKGGVIIRVGDEVMDGSVGRKLAELKKELER